MWHGWLSAVLLNILIKNIMIYSLNQEYLTNHYLKVLLNFYLKIRLKENSIHFRRTFQQFLASFKKIKNNNPPSHRK